MTVLSNKQWLKWTGTRRN